MKSNPLATRYVAPGRIPWQSVYGAPDVQRLADDCDGRFNARCAIVGPHGSGKSTLLENLIPRLGTVILDQTAAQLSQSGSATSTSSTASSIAASANSSTSSSSTSTSLAFTTESSMTDSVGMESSSSETVQASALGTPSTFASTRQIVRLRLRGWWASTRLLMRSRSQWCVPGGLLILDGYEQLPRLVRGGLILTTWLRGIGLLVTSHRRTALPTLVQMRVRPELAQHLLEQLVPLDIQDRAAIVDIQRLSRLLEKHNGNLRELFMELYDELDVRLKG